MKALAIIAASGVGKRMKLEGGQSKQMLEISGLPVIVRTLRAFEEATSIEGIYIATKADSIAQLKEMIAGYGFRKVRAVIEGGAERQDSIGNCIDLIREEIGLTGAMPDAILVHDGARPLIRPGEIDDIAGISAGSGACVPATRPKDTIKYVGSSPGVFGETLDRSRLLQVQTPQGFTPEKLIEAHMRARRGQWYATDDAALVERFFPEQAIRIYETGYHNIKITTPEDVFLAEAILASLERQEQERN